MTYNPYQYGPYPTPFKAVAIADFSVAPVRVDKVYRVSEVRYLLNQLWS
jgi:hypothetical protein